MFGIIKTQLMSEVDKIVNEHQRLEISSEEALDRVLFLYNVGRSFIHELIQKETDLRNQLSKNLDLYKSKNLMVEYDSTFRQWNKCNLVLWDLKDILCRMGEDLD